VTDAAVLLPLFPLPGVVFLPDTPIPLHVFEPRYRKLFADAWEGERLVGLLQLDRGWEEAPEPKPVRPIGCAGEIVEVEPLEDGRSNVVLVGRWAFRIEEEIPHDLYRLARVAPFRPPPLSLPKPARDRLRDRLSRRARRLATSLGLEDPPPLGPALSDEAIVNRAALVASPTPDEAYELLGRMGLDERYAWALARIDELQARCDLLAPFRPKELRPERN
jgi:Lon protease-like protein